MSFLQQRLRLDPSVLVLCTEVRTKLRLPQDGDKLALGWSQEM